MTQLTVLGFIGMLVGLYLNVRTIRADVKRLLAEQERLRQFQPRDLPPVGSKE